MKQTNSIIEEELINRLDRSRLPAHIAIIMDGNGRWAKAQGLPRSAGHRQGMETVREIVRFSNQLGIKCLTLFAFSTENWKRPLLEISFLMGLPAQYLNSELPELIERNVKINWIGSAKKLPSQVQKTIACGLEKTSKNTGMILNFALNYGSRQEIVKAAQKMVKDILAGKCESVVSEQLFASYLDTVNLPDPDLLIRTSGEYRLSNFLLWQIAYSELWFTEIHWPEFNRLHLLEAIYAYQQRSRRFGTI